jgi:hypothetical protein
MTREQKRAEAERLRAEGMTLQAIAERLGYAAGASAWKLLNPEAAAAGIQRQNARRGPAKRAWARKHDTATCPCGTRMGEGSIHKGYALCATCRDDVARIGRALRCERIADMWEAGMKQREIAAALDSTTASIGATMAHMRAEGWDLPYRYRWSPEGLERAQTSRLAA